jgi:phosphatidylglycerophosphatase A
MRERLIRFVATGFCSGFVPVAPGTAGSVVGVGYWWLLVKFLPAFFYWPVTVVVALLAVWFSGAAAKTMREKDPSCVVIDEIAAVPVALAWLSGWWLAVAFVLFRVFDAWKPPGIRQSQDLPGGWGIVVDDLLAAALACGVTHAAVYVAGSFR